MADVPRIKESIGNVLVIATDKTYKETPLLAAVERGQFLKLTSTGWRLRQAAERADGVAMKDGYSGQVGFDILTIGEQDGYTGLVTGASLYPSTTTNGELQTDTVASYNPQVKVVRPSRIRINVFL